jgi:hypothetical protein
VDHPVDHQEPGDKDGRGEPVHVHVIGERQQPEGVAARHLLDAVLAAGERRLQAEEVDELR